MQENELPKLTKKENDFVMRYLTNGYNKSEAYRYAYNCENWKAQSITVEANVISKRPSIKAWIDFYTDKVTNANINELKYSAIDFFDECNELKEIALDCRDKYGNPNVLAAIKAVENKAKVCGILKDQVNVSASVTKMNDVTIDGSVLTFNTGSETETDEIEE